jgi:hypothetical protein
LSRLDEERHWLYDRSVAVELPDSLGVGKLLRLQGMVNAAAQTEATRDSATALVRAYMRLREEIHVAVESDQTAELQMEFERLFPPLEEPGSFSPALAVESHTRLAAAAEEGRIHLSQLGGWIQGLIEERTLQERMRLDAEARAREAAKPKPGFTG